MNVKCGSPYFKVDEFRNDQANTTLQVSWIEFDWSHKGGKGHDIKKGKKGKGKNAAPWDDWPSRDQKFYKTAKTDDGQFLPGKKSKSGKKEKPTKIDGKKGKKQTNPTEDETADAEEGFGTPTTGFYDPKKKGYKAFGTIGQGDEKRGARAANDTNCNPRKILVTVTAVPSNSTNDTADASALVLLDGPSFTIDLKFLIDEFLGQNLA
jgi:hypothetical protein